MNNKERFIEVYKKYIHREGSDKLLEYLMSHSSDFFDAPASARYHGNYDGGLVEHSLNVYENGQWKQVPTFEYNDTLPYGHGEKSVYMISGYMRLTREEAFAIRYHMGFSGSEDARNVGAAFEMFPLAFALSTADMEATYFIEGKN